MRLSSSARLAGHRLVLLALCAMLVVFATQCLNHPRDGQTSASKSTAVAFDGFIPKPSTAVQIFVFNNSTGNFDPVAHAPIVSDTNGYTDKAGTTWYAFSASVQLPSGSSYWSIGTGLSNAAKVRVVAAGGSLATFDVNADACMQAQTSGIAVLTNCHSDNSPTAVVNATCGGPGGDCCVGIPHCVYGANCGGNGVCSAPCGGHGAACCEAAPGCDSTDQCTRGTCECGGASQMCCPGGPNGGCNSGLVCGTGGCQPCGKLGSACCHDGTCNGGTCDGHTCTCGSLGQACCPGGSAGPTCLDGNVCNGGVCAVPNKPPPTCQGPGAACGTHDGPYCCSNEVCNYGTCFTCTPHGAECQSSPNPCCTWQDICVINLETGGSQCDVGDSQPEKK
jgi:hypothetical protein